MPTRIIEGKSNRTNRSVMAHELREQVAITATASPASSAAFGPDCNEVMIQSDEQVYVDVGPSPTAATNTYRIAAGGEQAWRTQPGHFVSVRT